MPWRPGRVCRVCKRTAVTDPCRACQLERLRARPSGGGRRGYDAAWQRLAAQAIAAWVEVHGWVCPGYEVAAHTVPEGALQCDHVDEEKRTGLTLDDVGVLCGPCNRRKSGTHRRR